MADAKFDVLTIGNAIVDVLAHAEEDFLLREGLVKGSMRLIDGDEAERLYDHMGTVQLISGGCAGNTAAGVASFGGRTAFIGKVADDELGRFYRHDMHALGIAFGTPPLNDGTPTARSMILITPDGERTMNTNLAACQELTPDDIDARYGGRARRSPIWKAICGIRRRRRRRSASPPSIAHGAGRKVAMTLSDSFCVDRFRDEFLELMRSGQLDIVFANQHEVLALYQTSDFDSAVACLQKDVPLAVVTMSEKGSMAVDPAAAHRRPGRDAGAPRRPDRRRRPLCLRLPLWPVARLRATRCAAGSARWRRRR